jgi:hypothetical protein
MWIPIIGSPAGAVKRLETRGRHRSGPNGAEQHAAEATPIGAGKRSVADPIGYDVRAQEISKIAEETVGHLTRGSPQQARAYLCQFATGL